MSTKLTLSLDEVVIKAAKKYAKDHKTSISRLVEQYFLDLIYSKPKKRYPKELQDLIGVARIEDPEIEYKKEKLAYLSEKYLRD